MRKRPVIRKADLAILVVIAASAAYLFAKMDAQTRTPWNWGIIWQYMARYDQETGRWVPNLLLHGLLTTIRLSLWATILASLFGMALGLLRVSRRLFNRLMGAACIETVRNLPPIVLVFIFYFFISNQIMPLLGLEELARALPESIQGLMAAVLAPPGQLTEFASAVMALAIYEASYMAEIIRAGIQSVEMGQWEASYALGLSWWQQMRRIILPQALRRVLPPLAGQFISTITDSAIISVISVQELTFQGLELMATTYHTYEIWITIAVMYFMLTFGCSLALRLLERHHTRQA